jgi:predicted metal-dependent hydrolase
MEKERFDALKAGFSLYNSKKFWECHEELEHHWLESLGDPFRYVYWSVIQAAAAMVHYREGNLIGTRGMISKACRKIEKIKQMHVDLDGLDEQSNWNEFINILLAADTTGSTINYDRLFEFNFRLEGA